MKDIIDDFGIPPYKLNVGAGSIYREGYINIDLLMPGTNKMDIIADAGEIPLPNNSCIEIGAYHLIEHLSRPTVIPTLKHWYKLLRNGGRLILELPDFDKVVGKYLLGDNSFLVHIFGNAENEGQHHYWGYNFKNLKKDLELVGFKDITLEEATDYHTEDEPCFRIEAIKMARREFHLEPTNICSREGKRCVYCSDKDTRKKGFLDIGLAGNILEQIKNLNSEDKEILLFLSGEPLLHPQIGELIILANNVGASIIHTNADALTEEKALQIINAGLTRIFINLHNRSDIGKVPDETITNIKHFLELNDHTIETHLQKIVPFPEKLPNAEDIKRDFPGVDFIDFRRPHNWAVKDSIKGSELITEEKPPYFCSFLTNNMAINWEGKVHLCCACLNDERIIGDINKESIKDIDKKLDDIYKQQLDKEEIPICSNCERYQPY